MRVRGSNHSHLNVAALRAIAEFLTQLGAPCKSTIVLAIDKESPGVGEGCRTVRIPAWFKQGCILLH